MESDQRPPVVEPKPTGDQRPDLSQHSLELRIRQQEFLAKFGVFALKGVPFSELIELATVLTAEGLEAEFCKVMEYIPGENASLCVPVLGGTPK